MTLNITHQSIRQFFKSRCFRFAFCLMAFFIFQPEGQASHIIGGEMNYKCLGSNKYEITLTVYRDCFYANPLAIFDDPAFIGVYFANGSLRETLQLPVNPSDTLTPILSDPCFFVPDDVCVETTTYREIVDLPYQPGGYTLTYQRCCRNQTITNIVEPENTGATFTVTISDEALLECNSGAVYNDWPPLFICVNEPINFDHSAIDAEGDSLVYSLCTPYAGGTFTDNQPNPPAAPPYDEVVYAAPYNLDNILGGNQLQIDSETGFLTGTPSITGQFVVGICIEEYRNGQLISSNRRDFQYNVGQCLETIPIVGNPNVQCGEDLTVNFINDSELATNFLWKFGDPTNPSASSTEESPSYTYPDTGTYVINLITEPGSECADTVQHELLLKYSTLEADFNYAVLECDEEVVLSVQNLSVDSFSNIESYEWTLSDGQTSDAQNPTFIITTSGELTLDLIVNSDDGCSESFSETFDAAVLGDGTTVIDTLIICPGESTPINPFSFLSETLVYSWSPAESLDDPTAAFPIASPDTSTTYTVFIQDTVNMCEGGFKMRVAIPESTANIQSGNGIDTTFCGDGITLFADSINLQSMMWSTDIDFNNIISNSSSVNISHSGAVTYYLAVVDNMGCEYTDSLIVYGGQIDATSDTETLDNLACQDTPFDMTVTNNDAGDILTYSWSPTANIISGENSATATAQTSALGADTFYVEITNQFGCSRIDTVEVFVLETSSPTDFETIQDCNGFEIEFNNPHFNAAYYTWDFGDGNTSTEINPTHTYSAEGSYTVQLIPIDGLPCAQSTFEKVIEIPAQTTEPSFTFEAINLCGDSAMVSFTNTSIINQGTVTDIIWDLGSGLTSTEENPTVILTDSNPTIVLSLTTDEGCVETILQAIDLSDYFVQPVIPSFTFTSDSFCEDIAVVQFNNTSVITDGNITSYFWDFGNGQTSTEANPTITFNNTNSEIFDVQLTLTTSEGCTEMSTQSIDLSDFFTDTINTDFEFSIVTNCLEDAVVQFTDLSTYSQGNITAWNWSFSNGQSSTNQNPIINVDATEPLTVSLTIQTDNGCSESSSEAIQIVEFTDLFMPVANVDFDFEIAACGDDVTVQFSDASEALQGTIIGWNWNFGNGQTSTDQNPIATFTAEENPSISLTIETDLGCFVEASQAIELTPYYMDVSSLATAQLKCSVDAINLNEGGNPNYTYEWTPAENLDDATAANPLANPESTTTYQVIIRDEAQNCEVTRDVTVTVPDNTLDANFDWQYENCLEVATVNFTSEADYSDGAIASWEWSLSDGSTYDTENFTTTMDSESSIDVTLTVTSEDGCTTSSTRTLNISILDLDLPEGNTQFLCNGSEFLLNENGNTNYEYTWSPAASLDDANSATPTATPTETTTYSITVEDTNTGCIVDTEVTIEVPELLEPTFQHTYEDCTGPALIQFEDITNYGNGNITDWDWNFSTENTSELSNPTIEINENTTVEVELTVTAADGCIQTITELVDLNIISFEVEDNEIVVCNQVPTELNPSADMDLVYNWSPEPGLSDATIANPTANPSATTTYTVSITDPSNGGCEVVQEVIAEVPTYDVEIEYDLSYVNCEDSVTIQLTDLTNTEDATIIAWDWTFGSGMSSDEQNPSILVTEDMPLNVFLTVTTEDGCSYALDAPQSFNIDITDISSLPESVMICQGEETQLNVGGDETYEYNWSPAIGLDDASAASPMANPLETTTYTVTITNFNGIDTCELIETLTVMVPELPSIEIEGDDIICEDQTTIAASGNTTDNYVWSLNSDFTDVIAEVQEIMVVPGTQGTMYYAQVTDSDNCINTDSFFISHEPVDVEILEYEQVCFGDTVFLEIFNQDLEDELTYQWTSSTNIIDGQGTEAIELAPEVDGEYGVLITNQYGCTIDQSYPLNVFDLSEFVDIDVDVDSVFLGGEIQLNATENPNYSYDWIPPTTLSDPNISNPIATPEETTNYVVVVQDENGCLGSASIQLSIRPSTCDEPFVFIPNTFTPNNDDTNDILYVNGQPIEEMHLTIMNRWGECVFESFDKNMGWDGTYKGKELSPDVFGFYLTVKCFNGEEYYKQGNINLIR